MITLYAACLRRLGLSQDEAGVVHARYGVPVRPDTIKSWAAGRREPPRGAFEDLRRYQEHLSRCVGPADLPTLLWHAEQVGPQAAHDLDLVGPNSMMAGLAARVLEPGT